MTHTTARLPVLVRCFAQFVEVSFSEVANRTQIVVKIFVFVYIQLSIIHIAPQVCSSTTALEKTTVHALVIFYCKQASRRKETKK